MIKYMQLPFSFDEQRMQHEVQLLSNNTWRVHHQKLHYEGEWSALPLRSVEGKADNIIVSPVSGSCYEDTVFLKETPYLQEVLAHFKCPLMAVRLLKLNAGAVIKEHHDAELCFEKGEIRLHIPVITHEGVEFYLDKERIPLKEGECWYMNFNLPHSLINKSKIDRIHLVIDAKVNGWVEELFARNDYPVKKEMEDRGNNYDAEMKKLMIARFRQMNTETANRMADELEESL